MGRLETGSAGPCAAWREDRLAADRDRALAAGCRRIEALIADSGHKVSLVVDDLKVHHSKPVKAWVAEHTAQIELVYLPSYSPEANPDKYFNRDLKTNLRQGPVARTIEQLPKIATGFMRHLQEVPGRVVSYFKHPAVSYVHIS